MPAREVAVDDRGRCNLAKVRTRKFSRYFVAEDEDGVLTLTPAITLTPAEVGRLREDRGWLPPDARVLRLPGEAPREPPASERGQP